MYSATGRTLSFVVVVVFCNVRLSCCGAPHLCPCHTDVSPPCVIPRGHSVGGGWRAGLGGGGCGLAAVDVGMAAGVWVCKFRLWRCGDPQPCTCCTHVSPLCANPLAPPSSPSTANRVERRQRLKKVQLKLDIFLHPPSPTEDSKAVQLTLAREPNPMIPVEHRSAPPNCVLLPAEVTHSARLSVGLSMHHNKQFPVVLFVTCPSSVHVLLCVTGPLSWRRFCHVPLRGGGRY